MSLEINRMLVLSTAHVSQETADKLPRGHADMVDDDFGGSSDVPSWGPAFARAEGWLFYVGDAKTYEDAPSDLKECVAFANSCNCVWLMFDRDGNEVPQLPTYEW